MLVPCTSFKAINSATQIRSKIEAYIKKINGNQIGVGPLGPKIEDAYSRGLIDQERKETLEKILVECETIIFNMRDGEPIEFKEIKAWSLYVDSLA
jgi:hypothetical protein